MRNIIYNAFTMVGALLVVAAGMQKPSLDWIEVALIVGVGLAVMGASHINLPQEGRND